MKTRSRIRSAVLATLVVAGSGWGVSAVLADTEVNPYASITTRNAFDLREPTVELPPVKPVEEPVVENVDVFLTGVAMSNGEKRAYFMVPDPEKPGRFKYYDFHVKGGNGPISERKSIDLEGGKVEISVNGRPVALNLEDNGYKGRASVRNPIVAAGASQGSRVSTNPAAVQQPNRTIVRSQQALPAGARVIGRGGATNFQPGPPSAGPALGISTGDLASPDQPTTQQLRTLPVRPVRSAPTTLPLNEVEKTMSAEERAATALLQKEINESRGILMPPLPFGGGN